MQAIYNLVYNLARAVKSRFGYAVTISQAKFAAYAAFLVSMWLVFSSAIKSIYFYLASLSPLAEQAVLFMPSASVVASVSTAYISALVTRKLYDYVHDAWSAWMKNNGM